MKTELVWFVLGAAACLLFIAVLPALVRGITAVVSFSRGVWLHWRHRPKRKPLTARELALLSGMVCFLAVAAWLAREVSIYRSMFATTNVKLVPPFTNTVTVNLHTNYAPEPSAVRSVRLDSPHNLR